MKVLFWTDGFWPRKGGIETQALQYIQGMQQRGHEYRVFAQKDSPSHPQQEIYQGISIRRFDFRRVQQDLRSLRVIREEMQAFQPAVIHLNAGSGLAIFVFLLLKQLLKTPIILTLHAPFFYEGSNPLLERMIAISDRVCCVSTWVLEETRRLIPAAASKLELIYNGLPLPRLVPTQLPFSPPVLLLLGRLAPEKGFETAIQAFALLKKSGSPAKLLIAGGGPERPFLERIVEQLGLKNSVQFTGEFSHEEAFHWINQATALLVPSYFEPFGLVALEAMLLKRPVIASRVGGLQEILLHGETGLLVPPQDPLALYTAMQTLLSRPEKAFSMGLQGHKRATEQFTLEKNLNGYEKILSSRPSFML